jgi:predicted O-methyltransferase YrrM
MTSKYIAPIAKINQSIKYRGNRILKVLISPQRPVASNIDNAIYGASNNSDISEHLHVLNFLIRMKKPEVLVELGTRGGESTRVFVKALGEIGGQGYSVDLMSAPEFLNELKYWKHFVGDDVAIGQLAKSESRWPNGDDFNGIDFLFLDTSHEYDHTVEEIAAWWPLLNPKGLLIFHDTNLTGNPTKLLSGGFTKGWDNKRGVSRAIEEYFAIQFNENSLTPLGKSDQIFVSLHLPWSNGLSIIQKM